MNHSSNSPNPPEWLRRLLLWFCDDQRVEEIEGDLLEAYQHDHKAYGLAKARQRYFIAVIKFVKPRFMQKLSTTQDYAPHFANYLKVSLRNFKRYKLVSTINLLGFALGLMVMVLAGEYLNEQLSADRFMPHPDRVYRVTQGYRSQVYANLAFEAWDSSDANQQKTKLREFAQIPEVELVTQFTLSDSDIMGREFFVEANGKRLPESSVLFTNAPTAFHEIFGWEVLAGGLTGSLQNQVLLTRSTAEKYFGEDWRSRAIGTDLLLGETPYLIKAVVEDVPDNAHFSYGMAAMVDSIPYTWGAYTYARLIPDANVETVASKFTEAHYRVNPEKRKDAEDKGLFLQSITDIHLGSNYLYELETNLNPTYLYLFGVIGLIMLVIVTTNYINLSIAIYSSRLKEIGVRKTLGARKTDIKFQFLFESAFTTLLALPVALALVYVALPTFNELLNVKLELATVFSLPHLAISLVVTLVIGLVCGSYPATLLSRRSLLTLFKGGEKRLGGIGLRKVLIGFQFALLMLLSGFAFYVNRQLSYIDDYDLGFEEEGIVSFDIGGVGQYQLLRAALRENPNVLEVGSGGLPGNNPFNTINYRFAEDETVFDDANMIYMDLGAVKALGIESEAFMDLEKGREMVMVVNETAAKKYEQLTGKDRNALLSKQIIESPDYQGEDGTMGFAYVVDGFVPDYNFFSLREAHNPLFILVYKEMNWVYDMHVKIKGDALFETMGFIEDAYYQFEKENPFKATFLEDRLQQLYDNESRISQLVAALSYLSVLLAFAGLIGLTYYMARVRQREVAIRKVLGAQMVGLMALLSREFVVMALCASLVAIPATMLLVSYWLQSFAFHIEPNIMSLVALGALGVLIMLVAVVSQSYGTLSTNPGEALKQE